MPDPLLWGKAFALAALVSAALTLLARRIASESRDGRASSRSGAAAVFAVAAGFAAGCWLLRLPTAWRPASALDRFLTIVFPAVAAVELIAAYPLVSRRLAWILRIVLAGATGRILLHSSVYLGGPHREWTEPQAAAVLAGSAATLVAVWWQLSAIDRRGTGAAVPLSLAMTLVGSGCAVMLEGYLKGGIAPLPLAAAILGTTAAALRVSRRSAASAEIAGLANRVASLLREMSEPPSTSQPGTPPRHEGPPTVPSLISRSEMATNLAVVKARSLEGVLGLGVVGLFSTLFIGRFFASLSTGSAIALFSAPLWGQLAEWLPTRWREGTRGLGVRLLLVALPIAVVLLLAMPEFVNETLPLLTSNSGDVGMSAQ